MKFREGPYSYQQYVSAMVPLRVGFKFYLRSTFSVVGQDAASERHHCRNTNVRGKPHWTMRLLFIALTFLVSGQVLSQPTDNYVRTIEKLRSKGVLTTKSSIDKTFVGSVTGYYDKNSIVLISSLTDAEAAGTETLYFIKDGILKKVFVMDGTFDSNEEWKEYYSKHKSLDNCYNCHGKPNCIVTEITFGDNPTIVVTENKRKRELTGDDRDKMLLYFKRTCDELKVLLKELE
jgi:hypothetical protein